jgi:hypothetical protein
MKLRHYVLGFIATLATLPALAAAPAAGIDGKWLATVDGGPNGPIELTFDLKAEGEKLTGNLSMAMMPAPTPVSEGTIKGQDVSFKLSINFMEGAPPLVISYTGKLKGDELAMKSVFDMGQGPTESEFIAKRAK